MFEIVYFANNIVVWRACVPATWRAKIVERAEHDMRVLWADGYAVYRLNGAGERSKRFA